MSSNVQNLNFTRWVYGLNYSCPNTFNEFILLNRVDLFSSLNANRYELALRVQLEPHKGINSKTKGAKMYFSNWFPHDPKDETGMFPTIFDNIYFGDLKFLAIDGEEKKVLVLFQILKEDEQLIIDVFDDYYTSNIKKLNKLLNSHSWHKKSTPRSA